MIPLSGLPRALAQITANGETRTYDTCRKAAVNCVIPVSQSDTGRYSVEADRLPEIALALGLTLSADRVAA
jgi:hypothetical protein